MANVMIKDIPTGNKNEFIEVYMTYSLGGINYFTYDIDPRGYWLHVRKVEKADGWITASLMEGRKLLLKEVKRKSQKAEKEALNIAMEKYPMMVQKLYGVTA